MIAGYENERLSYLVVKKKKVLSVLHKTFKQMTSKILKIRSLEVVAVCGLMSRSQEDAALLACAFLNIPGTHPLWTSLRHERSMSITILRDSHFGAFLTWRIMRQQTPVNEKKCLPVSAAWWYVLK